MDGQSLPISRFPRILRRILGWCKNQSAFFSSSPLSSLGRNSLNAALWRKCKVAGWWWIYVCADFKSAANDNGNAWMMMSSRVNNGDIIDNSTGEGNLAGVYYLVETNQPFPAVCSLYWPHIFWCFVLKLLHIWPSLQTTKSVAFLTTSCLVHVGPE